MGQGPVVSISEQQIDLGRGFAINPLFSVYSASMVGVFCALILAVSSPLLTAAALIALLICYLLTCIFIFGSFQGFLSDEGEGDEPSRLQLGLPGRFVVLFCLSSLAALYGTYSALDPIAGAPAGPTFASKEGAVTLRFKQGVEVPEVAKSQPAGAATRVAKTTETTVESTASKKSAPDLTLNFQEQKREPELKPILASVRSDDLIGQRTIRSHAWAVREAADLPTYLKLPSLLFAILYGDDEPAARADMVIAKRDSGGSARRMVAFLTTPQSAFKNHPAPRAGGTIVVQKRETVALMRPAPAPAEPITIVQKTPATVVAAAPANSITVAKLDPPAAVRDQVAVTSTKQDLQQATRTAPTKPTAARTPEILLPPVLASIFYGRPGTTLEPVKAAKKAPRLTTLFKTAAPNAVQLVAADPVTVVAKRAPAEPSARHPIALAALADTHRMNKAAPDGLGGPFTGAVSDARGAGTQAEELQPVATPSVITGSISPSQINSALRSLRFVPRFEEKAQTQRQNAKSGVADQVVSKSDGPRQTITKQSVAPEPQPGSTVILKREAAQPVTGTKVALAALSDDGTPLTSPSAGSGKQNAMRLVVGQEPLPEAREALVQDEAEEGTPAPDDDTLRLNLAPEEPGEAPLSPEAMREANEEINSALRGAEADLKDTDALLDEINVIWKEQDKTTRRRTKRPDKNAATKPVKSSPAPQASVEPTRVVIEPAAHSRLAQQPQTVGIKGHKSVAQLPQPVLLQRPQQVAKAAQTVVRPAPEREKRQLLGYIREQGSLQDRDISVDCGVVGADSKLRRCKAGSANKL